MEQITNILYWLSTGLLIPVIVFLLFFFAQALLTVGHLYNAYIKRSNTHVTLNRQIDELSIDDFMETIPRETTSQEEVLIFLNKLRTRPRSAAVLNKILGDYEIVADRELGKSKNLLKLGPMLGLMGTLIPMGPALVGLATGDITSMANNMQVAFSTTVVGIVIGAIGFISLQLKQRWVADDMNILEYVVESLKENQNLSTEN